MTTPERAAGRKFRKVFLVIGYSRAPGKVRVRAWSEVGQSWTGIATRFFRDLVPAPRGWGCTRHALESKLAVAVRANPLTWALPGMRHG